MGSTLKVCTNGIMPARSSKGTDPDFATVARNVVEQAIGEKLTGEPPWTIRKQGRIRMPWL